MKRYIYESPDGGKTIYRRPANDPHAKREPVRTVAGGVVVHHQPPEFDVQVVIDDDGGVNVII